MQKADIDTEEFEFAKDEYLAKNLNRTTKEIEETEERTRDQADCPEWINERKFLLTASNFGNICKKRPTTKNGNLLKAIMYNSYKLFTATTNYGKINEHRAKEELERK